MSRSHWDRIYREKASDELTWYQPHLERSLALMDEAGIDPSARVVDIGGGASTLVDDLLERGHSDVTVVDLSAEALEVSKKRLGPRSKRVKWVVGDVTQLDLGENTFDLWHDRAVFHFLTDPEARRRYLDRVCRSLTAGGHVMLATFAPDGPEKCSGLPVVRYSVEGLKGEFHGPFDLVAQAHEDHETPWGSTQSFVYCLCNKVDDCPQTSTAV
jgi:SAM-dependent methyltransferase